MIKVKLECNPIINKTLATSKGNQMKWFDGKYWYKADEFGYEGLSEYVCSKLMKYSNFTNYVDYEICEIEYDGRFFRGCRSISFLKEGYEMIPLARYARITDRRELSKTLANICEISDRIEYVLDLVEKCAGVEEFRKYLSDMLLIDALFLNEDRHLNNIVFLRNVRGDNKELSMTPVFDMGAALFSDTRVDYPLSLELEKCYERIKAKPFSEDFDEQLDFAETFIKSDIRFDFDGKSVSMIIDDILSDVIEDSNSKDKEKSKTIYSKEEINRVRNVLLRQFRRYSYLLSD